jgi:hypothetical protein
MFDAVAVEEILHNEFSVGSITGFTQANLLRRISLLCDCRVVRVAYCCSRGECGKVISRIAVC